MFGEPSWFLLILIGWTSLCEPCWEYSSNCDEAIFGSTCSGNIHPIRRTLPLIGWEQSSPVDEEEIKMDDSVARFFTHFRGNLFICDLCSLVSGTQNEIVVSWITLWGMIKVYWLDFSLHFRSCCLPQVWAEACISLQANWEWSKIHRTVWTVFGKWKVHVRNKS